MQVLTMGMHHKTPKLSAVDPRGLTIRTVDYWRAVENLPTEARINRTAHDAAGHPIKQWDPRLWALQDEDPLTPANSTTVHSLSGHALCTVSVDAGLQLNLPGLGDEILLAWDSRGTQREVEYDDLLRPVAVFEQGATEPRRSVERMTYGGSDQGDQNQCGQLIRHDDPAGTVLFEAFSITGQCVKQVRHFTLDPVAPDWPELEADRERLLEPGDGASSTWRFGPQGHVLEQTDAKENRQAFHLTLDGQLREARLQLHGLTAWQTLVRDIRYSAQGQVEHETAGNNIQTTLVYRPEDGLLMERRAQHASAGLLQHLIYDYDRMGNVLSIEDRALSVRYFNNQRIDPISRFIYDSLYQLIEAEGWEEGTLQQGPASVGRVDPAAVSNYRQTYSYDEGGNLLTLTHVGAQSPGRKLKAARYSNRCLPWRNGVPPTEEDIAAAFDAKGNLLELDQGRILTWDLRNQLQSVSPVERVSGLNDRESYVYDGGGQRVRKIRSLQTNARTVVAEVRYLPGLEMRSDNGTGEVLQVITAQAGLNSVRVLHWETAPPSGIANDQYRYSLVDHLKSCTLELADDARIISQETYYPFGETAWFAGAGVVEASYKTVRYSGKERDATGLDYYGYRYYAAWLQRWINPDPGGNIDGPNRYRAMRNNPLFYKDVDGLAPHPNQKTKDEVYHDLAQEGIVYPLQAAGMQPIRNYFADSQDPSTLAYRREIPIALEQLGEGGNIAFTNTHQAHVIAAVRTQTAPPSGAVLYHSGELISGMLNSVAGEQTTGRIMGPMSVTFNSPVEDPQVLADRRDAVAKGLKGAGKLASFSRRPALSAVGTMVQAMGRFMEVSEAQTQMQYRQLSNVRAPTVGGPPTVIARSSTMPALTTAQSPLAGSVEPSSHSPSPLAMRLLAAGFNTPTPAAAPPMRERKRSRSK
ncbi:RHS repeat-associated core domain protein-containing protein [Pseudomonas sp. GM79]|nr:RHS repeat-associated core domain protein-containing protein [Pseudomonas sp. GM79]